MIIIELVSLAVLNYYKNVHVSERAAVKGDLCEWVLYECMEECARIYITVILK